MRIALDVMGGDHGPEQAVMGAVAAAPLLAGGIVLVGDPAAIGKFLPPRMPKNVDIHPATEVIGMTDKPLDAIRKKRNSSIVVGVNLVKDGQADAFVSAGNTGACTAAALLAWRQVQGVHRPAIATEIPTRNERILLLDCGASPDIDPSHLVEFAIMGRAYCERVMGRSNPRVHLLNIGEEEGKGNRFVQQAYHMLAKHPWFEGNIEGKDMFRSPQVDVVVCDAFVGNVVLKTAEGVAEFIMGELKSSIPNGIGKLAFLPLRRALAPLRRKLDYAEIGGSPLLGLNGLCVICHGRSNAKAISNAIFVAARAVQNGLIHTIRTTIHPSR